MTTPTQLESLLLMIEDAYLEAVRAADWDAECAYVDERIILSNDHRDSVIEQLMEPIRAAYPTAYALWSEIRSMVAAAKAAERKAADMAELADIPF
jgi:hypothetical protein